MYVTFKVDKSEGRLSSIISNGKVYNVPSYYNVILDKKAMNYMGTNLSFNDALEQIKERSEREERNEKMNPRERSK